MLFLAMNAGLTIVAPSMAAPAGIVESLGAIAEGDASLTGRMVQLFVLLTVLSLAPGILIMATSFVRIVVVFSLLRSAIGLQQAPPNMVLVALALFLTGFIMAPTFETSWDEGIAPMLAEDIDQGEGLARAAAPFRSFMVHQTDPDDLSFFAALDARQKDISAEGNVPELPETFASTEDSMPLVPTTEDATPFAVLLPAFMISELSRAFEIGFLVMMPFLVIDLAIAAILMSMGMMMLPPQTVSLSMKIIFFVLIDGWRLLSESLVQSFF